MGFWEKGQLFGVLKCIMKSNIIKSNKQYSKIIRMPPCFC